MILTASRGKPFKEEFNFKNAAGKAIAVPSGDYRLLLERGDFVSVYDNLLKRSNGVVWSLSSSEVDELPYSTLYFAVTFNGGEIARGVLRVN
jgi:hypothetical protein